MDGSNLTTFLRMWKATYSLYKNRKLILEQLRNAGKEILIKDAILMVDADCAIYEEITADEQGKVTRQCRKPPTVTHCNGKEIWWNVPLNLPNKVEHNHPDIIV